MKKEIIVADRRFTAVMLVIGQILFVITTFLWEENGRYSINAGTLMVFSMLFWTIGFYGLFDWIKEKLFVYSRIGLIYALYGIAGGFAFAFEAVYTEAFNLPGKISVEAHKLYPVQMNLVLFLSGPAFPLTLLILGIMLAVTGKVNWITGILFAFGGISFPLGRILRIQWVSHLTDLILLIAVSMIALKMWEEKV